MCSSKIPIFIRMLDGTQETLELDPDTATSADVQSFVDARYEAAWRATGVRVLRRDLPFLGPALKISSHDDIISTKTLAENGVSKHTILHTYWPSDRGTRRDRERCGIGGSCNEADGTTVKRGPRKGIKKVQKAEKQAPRRAAELAVEVAAASEMDIQIESESRAIDVYEQGVEEEAGPEQREGRPAEGNVAPQVEEGPGELVQRSTEGPVDSVPQSEEDPFETIDQDKENWDPQIVPANLWYLTQISA